MEGYIRAQVEALQIPVLERLTLHLSGQPLPLIWLDTSLRPEVAHLAAHHRKEGSLTFTAQWGVSEPASTSAICWLVIEMERQDSRFALAFPLPATVEDLVDAVTSRSLILLFGECPSWLRAAGSRSERVEVARLQPLLEASLTLGLDANGCDRLAQNLLAWGRGRQQRKTRR
jgi:hypothetical protein